MRRHGQLGAYQLAVEERRLRRARRAARAAPPCCSSAGRPNRTTTLQAQAPLADDDEPGWADDLRRARYGRGDGRRGLHGDPRLAVRHLPGQGLLPGAARGAAAVTADGTRPAPRWASRRARPGARPAPRARRPSRWPSSRRRCGRCSSSPAPGRARPRRWPRGWSGSSPTTWCAPTRCSASPSPARPRASCPSGCRPGCATLREAGLWTPAGTRTAPSCSTTCPRSPPTTRTPGGSCASTGCGSGSSPRAGCSPRPRPGSSPHEAVVAWDGPMDGVDKAESTVTTAVVDLAGEMAEHLVEPARPRRATSTPSSPRSRRCPRAPARAQAAAPEVRDARRPCCASARAVLPLVERYHELKRCRDAMDFADQMALAARIATHGAAGGRRRAARASGPCCSTSSRTPPRPSCSCCARCSSPPGSRCRSPRSATRTSRSTAGAGRRRPRSTGSATTSPTPSRPAVLPLSTSWRNDRAVLAAANLVAGPLRRGHPGAGRVAAPHGRRPGRGHVATARLDDHRGRGARTSPTGSGAGCARPGRDARQRCCAASVPSSTRSSRRWRTRGIPLRGRRPRRPAAHPRGRRPRRPAAGGAGPHPRRPADAPAHRAVVPARRGRPRRPRPRGRALRQRPGRGDRGADLVTRRQRAGQHRRGARRPAAGHVGRRTRASAVGRRPASGSPGLRRGRAAAARRSPGWAWPSWSREAEAALGLDIEVLSRPGYTPGAARAHLDAFADVARDLRRQRRPAHPGRVPGLARGRRRRGARARPRLGRGPARRRAGHDRARGQGPGVGRRRRARAGRGVVPGALGQPGQVVDDGLGPRRPQRQGLAASGLSTPALRPARRPRRACPGSAGPTHHDWDAARGRASSASPAAVADHGITEERRLAYVAVTRARTRPAAHRARLGHGLAPRGSPPASSTRCGMPAGWSRARPVGRPARRSTTPSRRTRAPPRP